MKLDKADVMFSKYIREYYNWTCQRCWTRYERGSQGLHNSHYFGRSRESTRFDPENCTALCWGCHQYFDGTNPEAYREFKINQIGEERFKKLRIRAETLVKKDRKLSYLVAKKLYEELTTKNNRGEL